MGAMAKGLTVRSRTGLAAVVAVTITVATGIGNRLLAASLNDTYFNAKGTWGQPMDDQWAVKRVGLTGGADSAWDLLGDKPKPVVVALIDTGLDWNHKDLSWKNLWRNKKEIPDNGKDDDGNGYVDDVIGWNFMANNNSPWDHDGHGTFIAGVIAANQNNGAGIAGINPHARLMVLKAVNNFGHTRDSYLAKALVYAADNGARVANMSVGGKKLSKTLQSAVNYAYEKGVVIVVAAGNEGVGADKTGVAKADHVITVASTDQDDKRTIFSNWGAHVDIAAPGMDVLSLRGRRTDTIAGIPGVEYEPESSYVGDDKRYYRASGTSFSAPIVTGVASLLLSKNPELTPDQVKRILTQSARDIDTPGRDQFSGYGLLDARAALKADPEFFLTTQINGVEVITQGGKPAVKVNGAVLSNGLGAVWLEIGRGEQPGSWKKVTDESSSTVDGGQLGIIPAGEFQGAPVWVIKVKARHKNGTERESWFKLSLG